VAFEKSCHHVQISAKFTEAGVGTVCSEVLIVTNFIWNLEEFS
jgi:hypothetical protein